MIILKIFLYIVHFWFVFILTSVIYSESLGLPKYNDLKFYSGIIDYVGYVTDNKNAFIPVTVNVNGKHEQFRAPASVKHDLNKSKVGNYIKIGAWDKPFLFFFKETEVWNIELNNNVIYRYEELYRRTKSARPVFISMEIIFLTLYACIIKKTYHL